jgi:hypothetical protein
MILFWIKRKVNTGKNRTKITESLKGFFFSFLDTYKKEEKIYNSTFPISNYSLLLVSEEAKRRSIFCGKYNLDNIIYFEFILNKISIKIPF